MNYKEYEIDTKGNCYGYFEATSLNDCDAPIIFADTIEKVKVEIDELYLDQTTNIMVKLTYKETKDIYTFNGVVDNGLVSLTHIASGDVLYYTQQEYKNLFKLLKQ